MDEHVPPLPQGAAHSLSVQLASYGGEGNTYTHTRTHWFLLLSLKQGRTAKWAGAPMNYVGSSHLQAFDVQCVLWENRTAFHAPRSPL